MKEVFYFCAVTIVVFIAIMLFGIGTGGNNMISETWVQIGAILAALISNIIVLVVTTRRSNVRLDEVHQKVSSLASGTNSISQLASGNTNSISQLATGNANSHLTLSKEHAGLAQAQNNIAKDISILIERTGSASYVSQSLQGLSSAISAYANKYDELLQQNNSLQQENMNLKNKIISLNEKIKELELCQWQSRHIERDLNR